MTIRFIIIFCKVTQTHICVARTTAPTSPTACTSIPAATPSTTYCCWPQTRGRRIALGMIVIICSKRTTFLLGGLSRRSARTSAPLSRLPLPCGSVASHAARLRSAAITRLTGRRPRCSITVRHLFWRTAYQIHFLRFLEFYFLPRYLRCAAGTRCRTRRELFPSRTHMRRKQFQFVHRHISGFQAIAVV